MRIHRIGRQLDFVSVEEYSSDPIGFGPPNVMMNSELR